MEAAQLTIPRRCPETDVYHSEAERNQQCPEADKASFYVTTQRILVKQHLGIGNHHSVPALAFLAENFDSLDY